MVFGLPGYIEVMLLSLAMSLVSALISKYLGDQTGVKNLKAEMKVLNDKIKKAQKAGNQAEVSKHSSELMKISGRQFQMNMKPMMVTMVIFFVMLWFFGTYYAELIVYSPVNIPFIGNQLNWFWWYFLITLPASFFFRKLLSVD